MLKKATLAVELALAADGGLPTEVRLFRAGVNRTKNGTFIFSADSARSCMEKFAEWGVDLAFDFGHAMAGAKYSANPLDAMKASGWGKLEIRKDAGGNDEIHAVGLSWTPTGASMLKNREVRYCSPMFLHKENGEIEEILNVALTAFPATFGADPMMADRDTDQPVAPKEKPMLALLSLLGLPTESNEAAAVAKLNTLNTDRTSLLDATGSKSAAEALGKIAGWKESSTQVAALTAKLAEQDIVSRKAEVKSLIDAQLNKTVAPAEVGFLSAMGEASAAGLEQLKGYLAVKAPIISSIPAAKPVPNGAGAVISSLTSAQLEVARQLGFSPAKLAEHIAANGTEVNVGQNTAPTK